MPHAHQHCSPESHWHTSLRCLNSITTLHTCLAGPGNPESHLGPPENTSKEHSLSLPVITTLTAYFAKERTDWQLKTEDDGCAERWSHTGQAGPAPVLQGGTRGVVVSPWLQALPWVAALWGSPGREGRRSIHLPRNLLLLLGAPGMPMSAQGSWDSTQVPK